MAARARWRIWLESAAVYLALTAVALFSLFPVLWGVVTSFKDGQEAVAYPPRWWPRHPVVSNYLQVLTGSNLPRYFLNSAVVALCTIALSLAVGALSGYAAARFRFRGKEAVLFLILATIMIPGIVVLVPLYLLINRVGLHDTYWAMILVYTGWQVPSVLWLMRGFFESIPAGLEEAAMIDGCARLGAFRRVILPRARPGLVAAAIIVFVWVWNEFIIALTLTTSDSVRTLPVGLYTYVGAFGVEWGKLMAAVTVALAPILIIFTLLQRHLIKGLTAGATKG